MEHTHPDLESLPRMKGAPGLKTHAALAMVERLRTHVIAFADI